LVENINETEEDKIRFFFPICVESFLGGRYLKTFFVLDSCIYWMNNQHFINLELQLYKKKFKYCDDDYLFVMGRQSG